MKKLFISMILILCTFVALSTQTQAQQTFADAVATCEKYSQLGGAEYNNEYFNILITLEKGRGDTCIYKEKIFQNKKYQMLTCEFEQAELEYISKSMKNFTQVFKNQIEKNKIFEAKLTTNGEVFQKYLANPSYCKITHSKK